MKDQILSAQSHTVSTIEELLNDGSDPDAVYLIEHHISSNNFQTLENFAVEAFKLGYEITDPEEFEDENQQLIACCDVLSEIPLDADLINNQIKQIIELTHLFSVNYDGWGTYYEDGENEAEYEEEANPPRIH